MANEVPDFYTWKIIQFGYTPHERINREPTEAELERAVVIVVQFTDINDPRKHRYATIRHPSGFGVVPFFGSVMADITHAVSLSAERYKFELVEGTP